MGVAVAAVGVWLVCKKKWKQQQAEAPPLRRSATAHSREKSLSGNILGATSVHA